MLVAANSVGPSMGSQSLMSAMLAKGRIQVATLGTQGAVGAMPGLTQLMVCARWQIKGLPVLLGCCSQSLPHPDLSALTADGHHDCLALYLSL